MTRPELPADVRALVERAIDVSRKRLQDGGELVPMALIEAAKTAVGFIAAPMPGDEKAKSAWAQFIRDTSALCDSRFVLVVSECWLNAASTREELARLLAEFKEVRHMPGSRVGVLVQVETRVGLWQGTSDVVDFGGKGRTFGAVEMELLPDQEGRFASLLGQGPL